MAGRRQFPVRSTLAALALVGAIALAGIVSNFHLFQATQILVYAIAILGLNLLTGYNGQISLGHGAFFAIGAYAAAIAMDGFGVPYWLVTPLAAILCLAVGFLFGRPALRLEGHYLALATFALALAVPQILKHPSLEAWTGGAGGIILVKPDPPGWARMGPDQWLYFFVLAHVVVLFAAAANLMRRRIGRAILAIRDQPIAAETAGVDISLVKSIVFGVSAMYTGIAGALSAVAIQFVAPDSFPLLLSIFLMVGVVVGGVGSIWGALPGAAFILIVPNVSADISKAATGVIYAAALIVVMARLPNGIWGGIVMTWRRRGGAR